MGLKPQEIVKFKLIIKDLLISVKNGTLYDFDHPIYILSIRKLKSSLDDWFETQKQFILGFSSNRILMNSELIESNDEYLFELARLLHVKGMLSVEFQKQVEVKELAGFVFYLKTEVKGQADDEEKEVKTPDYPNINLKELDYRLLLTEKSSEYTTEEEEIWAKLFRMDISLDDGLSQPNVELMLKFFNQPAESASFLNKVYNEAIRKEADEQVVHTFQQAVSNICEYFRGKSKPVEQKTFKVNLAKIVSRLHPELVSGLFESTVINGQNFDLAQELLDDFSDQDIAEFIQSLIHQDGSINEYLLKIFQKMMPDQSSAQNVSPLVTDQLFMKHVLNPQSFQRIQLSIKELFKSHPQNHFLSEMYKITVDALSDTSETTLRYSVRMGPLVNQFVKTYEEGFFREERVWILLKVLASEKDYIDFQKYGEKLIELFRELLNKQDVQTIRNLLTFYVKEIVPARAGSAGTPLDREKNALYNKIVHEDNLKMIVDLIPDGSKGVIIHILHIMQLTKTVAAPMLVDTYMATRSQAIREKLLYMFSQMKNIIKAEVMRRIDRSNPREVRELFKVLQVCDPEKMNLAARKMINQQDTSLLWDALEHFIPKTKNDVEQLFKLFFKHDNPEIQKKAAMAILRSTNRSFLQDLFSRVNRAFVPKKRLEQLVEWCGEGKAEIALPELKDEFLKKPHFMGKTTDEIRLKALNSMCLIDTGQAVASFKMIEKEENISFVKKCEVIILKYRSP